VRTQGRDHQRQAATHIFARVAGGALFKSFTLTANGRLTRNESVIELLGDDAVAHIAGASMGDGDFHHDDTVFVTHAGQRCESRQVFKKVLKNGAVGVFQGKIHVHKIAQKTDGYQLCNTVMLSDRASMNTKPELEIYADDVKCSHGNTVGALDDAPLFYLRSRGIPEAEARRMMLTAFIGDLFDALDDNIKDALNKRVAQWLDHGIV